MIPRRITLGSSHTSTPLLVHGQGVFLFKVPPTESSCSFRITNKDNTEGLAVHWTPTSVLFTNIQTNEPLVDPKNTKGLTTHKGAFYWVSLDAQNQRLHAGVGEARHETVIYTYQFPQNASNKAFLEQLTQIVDCCPILHPQSLLRDPITNKTPLVVRRSHELTMEDVATGAFLPKAHLSPVAQTLYDCVGWKAFALDDPTFPDFSKAIERSIATPGLWCYEKLKSKASEFGKPNPLETYLRITLNENNGESPGIPYVMEIWPVGHFSPIHSHSAANAVIRVLHGSIHVKLFPYLCADSEGVAPFGEADFHKGQITWISPTLNQVHQLKNLDTNKHTCITIQCYMYDAADSVHYDYFDYIDADGNKQQYEPDSDMGFMAFKLKMKEEWAARPRPSWWCC